MVTTPLNLKQVDTQCTEDNLGSLRHFTWLTGTARDAARGSLLLLAPLAAAAAEGGLLLAAGFIIWAISGWVCHAGFASFRERMPQGHPLMLSLPSVADQDNGNEHFAPIFMDYSRSASLDLGEDCHCLILTHSAFPFF